MSDVLRPGKITINTQSDEEVKIENEPISVTETTKKSSEDFSIEEKAKDEIISDALQKLLDRKIDNTIKEAEASLVIVESVEPAKISISGDIHPIRTSSVSGVNKDPSFLQTQDMQPSSIIKDATVVASSKEDEIKSATSLSLGQEIKIPKPNIPVVINTKIVNTTSLENNISVGIKQPSIDEQVVTNQAQSIVDMPADTKANTSIDKEPVKKVTRGITKFFDSLFGSIPKTPPIE